MVLVLINFKMFMWLSFCLKLECLMFLKGMWGLDLVILLMNIVLVFMFWISFCWFFGLVVYVLVFNLKGMLLVKAIVFFKLLIVNLRVMGLKNFWW